jgi:hypothetical protein
MTHEVLADGWVPSFFTFDLSITEGAVSLGIGTGPAHTAVLAALGDRVESRMEVA